MNTFGRHFRLTSFGESHGPALGGVIDGCPAGISFDLDLLKYELSRRRPGQSEFTTSRIEEDIPELLSGVFEGKTTGAPICIIVRNHDAISKDYAALKDIYRPSHADITYGKKYGHRDYRGGGRASARETLSRIIGGAVATMFLKENSDIEIIAWVQQILNIEAKVNDNTVSKTDVERSDLRCPDPDATNHMKNRILSLKEEKDSAGGIISCIARKLPVGLGEPVFEKLPAVLASAMLSINAVKAFEIGSGFRSALMRGSEHNDQMRSSENGIEFLSNNSGGVLGGISNGAPLKFSVAFKPTATIGTSQSSVDKHGKDIDFQGVGRHDPCVLPRAVPIVEAMTALILADFLLATRLNK